MDSWRPQIETRLSAALGAPLRIGAIHVRSGSWVPAFDLDDVRLLDREGRVALSLGRVSAALSPSTLLTLRPQLSQLHAEGVQLDVRREADGRLTVAGLDLAAGPEPADPAAADWFFELPEFVIRHGALRWTDALRDAPALQLSDVDLVLRNGRRRHELRLDATPPAEWGGRFALRGQFQQPLTARAGDWQRWRGTLYAELPLADLAQLRQHVDLPFELGEGRGALRTWIEMRDGRPTQGVADVALAAVSLRLAPELPLLALQEVQGRLIALQQHDALEFALEGLRFVTDDAVAWAPSTTRLRLDLAPAAAGSAETRVAGGRLSADRLDLAPLARVAARLPLPASVHAALAELAPVGQLQALAVDWRGPPRAPTSYHARVRARALGLAAGPPGPPFEGRAQTAGRPGLRGADVELDATEAGGQAQLTLADGAIILPGVLEQPELPMASLDATLGWTVKPGQGEAPPAVELSVRQASFANADARGRLSGSWRTGPGTGFGVGARFPGQIDLNGRLQSAQAASVARYLPLGLPEATRRYVERAIGPGRVTDGEFAVQGDLWQFPYADGSPGTFRIRARAQDLRLAYVPSEPGWTSPWPAMSAVAGEIEFDRGTMRIRGAQAQLSGVALQDVRGGIADLGGQPVLRLEGRGRGALADMLRYVNATPVGEWIGGSLAGTEATGAAELRLALAIPLDRPGTATVKGDVQLAGNDLRLQPGTPLLGQARGRVDFSERGVAIVGGRARALGGDATLEGGTQADGSLRFTAQGTATAEALLRASDVPALAPLAALGPRLKGQAPYRVQLDVVRGRPALLVTSPLTGLSLDLPAPLAKPAAATWPLRVQTVPTPERPDRDQLRFELGSVLQARFVRDLSGPEARVLRGAAGIGAAPPSLPEAGVTALVQLPRIDVDTWRQHWEADAGGGTTDGFLPALTLLRTDELLVGGRRLHGVTLELQRQGIGTDTLWRADVKAAEVEGRVELRLPSDAGAPGRVMARLTRLTVPAAETGVVEDLLTRTPASVPALDLVIDDFQWHGRSLGRLEVEAVNRPAPDRAGGREWQLDRLLMVQPDARLQGSGRWSTGRRMALDFTLDLSDSGRFAERMGAGAGLKGGKGRIEGQLGWAGSPLSPDAASLSGAFSIALAEGRFLNAEPGAARLLGVLSLQALPRRLLLDFRDVFQEGFAFDQVSGDVRVDGGVAHTDNLRLVGVQAAVLIEGQADLARETQDLRIVAVPEVNAGAASLAYALVNPAVALGSFIAQWLLRQPMMAAGTREFRVTGSWTDPKVERVQRVAGAAAPAASAAAPANEGRTP